MNGMEEIKDNAFYRGIPFIWCSNNLTVNFVIQCYWYRQLSGDKTYTALEQACFVGSLDAIHGDKHGLWPACMG